MRGVACRLASIVMTCVGATGCGDKLPVIATLEAACADTRSAPLLTLVDTVVLAESDTIYLGSPAATFTLDGAGHYFIPDRGNNRVLQFSNTGALVRTFGRQGSGPGEFRGLGNAVMVAGGRLWQSDYVQRRISLFNTSGASLGDVPFDGRLSSLKLSDQGAWAGITDASLGLAVTRFDPTRTPDSLVPTMITLPSVYDEFPVLRYWDHTSVVAWNDTLVVAFGGVEYVVRYKDNGSPIDTAWVPACRRQGSPPDILAQGFRSTPRTAEEQSRAEEIQTKISGLLGMWRFSDGQILVWYQDPRKDSSGLYRSRAYLSVLSPDLQRACVDAELAGSGSERAILAVQDDYVHLLDQVVGDRGAGSEVRSVVRRYSIDTSQCKWLATSRPVIPTS